MTIGQIIRLSPEVGAVLRDAASCEDRYWFAYEAHKRQLQRLVGWDAEDGAPAQLKTFQAYEVAIAALVDVLDGRAEARREETA